MKLKILNIIFLISQTFVLIIFPVMCLNKMKFFAPGMRDSIPTTLESHLCHGSECITFQCRACLIYSVSGFNLPKECHRDHLSSVGFYGKAVPY